MNEIIKDLGNTSRNLKKIYEQECVWTTLYAGIFKFVKTLGGSKIMEEKRNY